ncbi:hypothetical protein LEP1GSC060_1262 [Leptospira weilii serovar Ranarum str. ICFT]|uniref:Uncharacterized protein n=1 Tax=Leptospira weilii serovar Ranarum str. ICFT TaxID=1218598 RepID=N1WFC8_9LEPT|nr:hypothetical protein LEP1GSC060_1262 [Leptospira weilii serovar Ranarum str. ICFT]
MKSDCLGFIISGHSICFSFLYPANFGIEVKRKSVILKFGSVYTDGIVKNFLCNLLSFLIPFNPKTVSRFMPGFLGIFIPIIE